MTEHARRVPERTHGTPPAPRRPRRSSRLARRRHRLSRTAVWVLAGILGFLMLVIVASLFWDEPLRREMERGVNRSLKGYTVSLPHAHFNLVGMSVELRDLTVRQQGHPEPPVAVFPRLHANLQWRELLTLHLVADFLFDRPRLYINLPQLTQEASDQVALKDKGWQQALEKIYPFKINMLRVRAGEVTYIDTDPERPLKLTGVSLRADNIRNIHSRERVYPSPLHVEGVIFGTGHGSLDGHTDLMAEPFPGIHAIVRLDQVPLDSFRPMLERANLKIEGGVLDTQGEIEYSPKVSLLHLKTLTIAGARVDYVHTAPTAAKEQMTRAAVKQAAKESAEKPGVLYKVDELRLERWNFGFVDRSRTPAYRIFVSPLDVAVKNLSNHFSEGPAVAQASGRFMASGPATASARFRSDVNGPDFDLKVSIDKTDLTKMNDLLRAYGKFDVVAGGFAFYTELHVAKGEITGYIKPLFSDMKVYDARQDKEKSLFRKLYEKLVGGVAALLQNRRTEHVATKADIQGSVGTAKASTGQVIVRLIENAFFRAILPGFDEALGEQKTSKK